MIMIGGKPFGASASPSGSRPSDQAQLHGPDAPRFEPSRGCIELPWPPASLSGHNKGHWHAKSGIVAKHREWARKATLAAKLTEADPSVPDRTHGTDIRVSVTFYPPNRRGDRVNFPNRMKPYWDGIADALKVNDSRFLPAFYFAEPVKNPRVVVSIG